MAEFDTEMLTEAIITGLEAMAFISPVPWEGPIPEAPLPALVISIAHHTDETRTCWLIASEAFGAHMSANVLDTPESGPEAATRAADALKELMNVVSGALLSAARAASSAVLAIDLPLVQSVIDRQRWLELVRSPGTIALDADGHFIAVGMFPGA